MQILFYAAKEDNLEICRLLNVCLTEAVHVPFFTEHAEKVPLPFTFADRHMIYYISEASVFHQISYRECAEGSYKYCLDFENSPVLEFAPSYELTDRHMEGRLTCTGRNKAFLRKLMPVQDFIGKHFEKTGKSYVSKKIKREATVLYRIH